MQITCSNCKKIWEVPAETLRAARLKYTLGQKQYEFTCPNCGAKTGLGEDEFRSYDVPQNVVPVTGAPSQPGPVEDVQSATSDATTSEAPTNPVKAPRAGMWQRRGIVRVRGLNAHRDHNDWSEIMGEFHKGERVTILDTWTDGEHTWVQLGSERWVNIEQDGESAIEMLDD